jgi:hypothetical protein
MVASFKLLCAAFAAALFRRILKQKVWYLPCAVEMAADPQ